MNNELFLEFKDQGRLAAVLHLPPPSKHPCPVIIYCPGKNGERYDSHRLAVKFGREIVSSGYAFLRFDYYGLGLSDGEFQDMTTTTKVSNVIKAYEFVRSLPYISDKEIILLGFSDGARIALMSANKINEQKGKNTISKLVLWSPIFFEFGGETPQTVQRRFVRHPKNKGKLVMPWVGMWISIDFYKDLKTIDVESEISKYSGKSLVIYGDNDPLIHEEFNYLKTNQLSLYKNDLDHKVYKIPRAGHLFSSVEFTNRLISLSRDWLTL